MVKIKEMLINVESLAGIIILYILSHVLCHFDLKTPAKEKVN